MNPLSLDMQRKTRGMKMNLYKKRAWLFIGLSVLAGNGYPQAGPEAPVRTIQVQPLSAGVGQVDGLFWMPESEWVPLEVPSEFLPSPQTYTGPGPIYIARLAPAAEEDPAPRYLPVAEVAIPENTDQVILLFTERNGNLNVTAIPLREQNFPEGSYMVFNQTGRGLVMVLEERASLLAAGAVRTVRPDNRERGPVPVVLRFTRDDSNHSLITSTWFYHPQRRRLVFLFEEEDQIRVRGITWYPSRRS